MTENESESPVEGVRALLRQERWDEAEAQTHRLLERFPTHAQLWAYQGLFHYRRGALEAAREALTRATECDPKHVRAGTLLVRVLDQLGRYEEALEVAERLHRVDPNYQPLEALRRSLMRAVDDPTGQWQKSAFLERFLHDVLEGSS